jgi:hypothetical protein
VIGMSVGIGGGMSPVTTSAAEPARLRRRPRCPAQRIAGRQRASATPVVSSPSFILIRLQL